VDSSTTGVTSGAGTTNIVCVPEFIPGFSGIRVALSVVFCVVFCRSSLIFYDLRLLITPLVS